MFKSVWVLFWFTMIVAICNACAHPGAARIQADLWQMEPIETDWCPPGVRMHGIYRVVTCSPDAECPDGKYQEFISYCHPAIGEYIAIHRDDLQIILRDATKPK